MRKLLQAGLLAGVLSLGVAAGASAGDAERGQELYESRCTGCHSLDGNRVGPAHRGVFGRKAGTAPDYEYSAAVRASSIVWGEATLNAWLTNPQDLIAGQRMNFMVALPEDRADIIAYLRAQSIK